MAKVPSEAVLELDTEKLKARVADAEMAILARLRGIARGAEHDDELQAMADGLATLRVLNGNHHRISQ